MKKAILLLIGWVFLGGTVWAGPVKNVLWVIGDGMGPEILGFWMQGVRYGHLQNMPETISHTEHLMNQGVLGMYFTNTYDTIVSDSAAAATQMATGKLSRPLYIGMDAQGNSAPTLLEKARAHGKAVGIISDAYVTDATPAGFTAHVLSRRQKYEIARQQIAFAPEVILGGGLKYFDRDENKDLLKQAAQKGYHIVRTKKQLLKAKPGKLLGLFADQGMPLQVNAKEAAAVPSLVEMTQKALDTLQTNPQGFVLMVEAGKIDWAAHANDPGAVLAEMKGFDELIGFLKQYVQEHPDTLLYVNADHDTGLGSFVYQKLGKTAAATKTAQGEALYEGNTDYASFNVYPAFEKQTRSLYEVYKELKALPADKRTPQEIQKRLSEALGEPVTENQFEKWDDLEGIFEQLNKQRGMAYATKNHSAAPLISIAYGAGAQSLGGIYHNTDILPRLIRVFGWE